MRRPGSNECLQDKPKIKKPSLCRVAVSAVDTDRDRQTKDMERDRDRHPTTSFTR